MKEQLIDRAIRIAKAKLTVTCVIVPNDVQELEAIPVLLHTHNTQPMDSTRASESHS
ncbi:MAG: hypothetical protein NVSMB27_21510 [Ktedonobacteraceae bacterium]